MSKKIVWRLCLALPLALPALEARAGAEPFIGQVMCGGWNFAPRGTLELAGQLLPISQYETLFNLIGTNWGGDGQTTFALPDLRGRVVVGTGTGPGGVTRQLGESGGSETVTLGSSQLPAHTHGFAPPASPGDASSLSPAGKVAASKARTNLYAPGPGSLPMQSVQSASSGGNQPTSTLQPYLAVKCVVAVEGIYPSQN
ncbi:phage tail protein [Roseateles violae]|uniref:Tail fiber protein n=1 Tax=Roseateles violae TaxID=3058042 RepID=A0ABT8DRZ5_9BURK|nr:tail fiber protein [Pelomonas sp. PFR6]MDN3920811.1 tail fiber protein [Pelomonas sp. PFR6]